MKLLVEEDLITADQTTLGGDDGIAVAYMMAILDDDTLKHPALECVITTDEEIGLLGAKDLDASVLKGKYMINLDSEEEGYLWISCAGGQTGISGDSSIVSGCGRRSSGSSDRWSGRRTFRSRD